ncbi:AraC family transcriptional regulator [Pukyongia salina]|uniref:AraC family transcriptional regulator n=1 Tax=Pukyongia salina TaxID=2094025 RepID=A0A2S0HSX1_9FLAO|nr:AraC family transcriptional regulator [Pukyongia salina]
MPHHTTTKKEYALMTYYEKELHRIRAIVYANEAQINTVIGVRNYIATNYELNVSLDMLSHIQFVSKFHLIRLFKKYYGLTPRQYLIDKRIERSKDHLAAGMTVTGTCFAVGFESLGSFSSLFKRKTGLSPAKFRKEQLSRSKSE